MNTNRTILHVDDDPSLLRLVAAKLTAHGCNVISLSDPTCAAQVLLDSGARLALLDIDMPHINGLDLLHDIKQLDGGIQVIMLTGAVSMSSVLQSLRWGAESCVFKPIDDFRPLLTAVDAAFEKIDRWWECLRDLQQRRSGASSGQAVSAH
ncbi:MAG: response regulator [Planctomycetales bacterium]|nr:response regulator [Planctomycetales bacterium]